MMFIMIAHIVGNNVPPPIVAVCFLILAIPEVMLGDEVAGAWMKAAGEETGEEEVDERRWTKDDVDDIVGEQDGKDIEDVPRGEGLSSDKSGPKSVEKDLKRPVGDVRDTGCFRGKIRTQRKLFQGHY